MSRLSRRTLAQILRDRCVSTTVVDTRQPEQLEQIVGAVGTERDKATLADIDGVIRH